MNLRSEWFELNWIESNRLLTDFYRTGFNKFFDLVQKQIPEWLGFALIEIRSKIFGRDNMIYEL